MACFHLFYKAPNPRAFNSSQQFSMSVLALWLANFEVPQCSHTMGDAERFKTTNNMYSIFSVPDHQNAQAHHVAHHMRKHATREFKLWQFRDRDH